MEINKEEAAQDPKTKKENFEKMRRDNLTGALILEEPILSRDEPVARIAYDFGKLKPRDVLRVLDSAVQNSGGVTITATQALDLFALAARGSGDLDEVDIKTRLGVRDTLAGVALGKAFFTSTLLVGQINIVKGS